MTNTPVPDYLKEETHTCDPDAYYMESHKCKACLKIESKALREIELGRYM